mmetsp:Transcript_20594/g.31190  ORF Transcript_20594/g.31190 Transcript_20594/m.31190 type:complete len:310 (+) Transcript_20594:205-1134(+)
MNLLALDDVAVQLTMILGTMMAMVLGIICLQTKSSSAGTFLPNPILEPSKYAYENFVMWYSPVWMSAMALIIIFQLYEQFDAACYNGVLGGLALPLVLQPLIWPLGPDRKKFWWERYSSKANLWIAIYSFIGNYWYTQYFYSVLKAEYTMPATRLNNVPIAMTFATHFYFSSYHFFSNALLRKIETRYRSGPIRTLLFVTVVLVFSYFTAFMETLTISAFPYYSFEDRDMAYTVGSAFYGIYFIVSFPAFYYFETGIDNTNNKRKTTTLWDVFISSCGYGMVILCLLDFVRLWLKIPLVVEISIGTSTQ